MKLESSAGREYFLHYLRYLFNVEQATRGLHNVLRTVLGGGQTETKTEDLHKIKKQVFFFISESIWK